MNERARFLQNHFEEIKRMICEEYDISGIAYDTWIEPLSLVELDGDTVYIGIPREIAPAKKHITMNYRNFFLVKITEQLGAPVDIQFVLQKERDASYDNEPEEEKAVFPSNRMEEDTPDPSRRSNLNARYTFDTFVVGSNNRFAHAAALAVAEAAAVAETAV